MLRMKAAIRWLSRQSSSDHDCHCLCTITLGINSLNLRAPLEGIVPIDEHHISFLGTTCLENYMQHDDSLFVDHILINTVQRWLDGMERQ